VVKKGKELKPNCYIRTKVDTDKMLVVAHASFQNEAGRWVWEDLHLDREIPLDVLDKPDQVTLERDPNSPRNRTLTAIPHLAWRFALSNAAAPPVLPAAPTDLNRFGLNTTNFPDLTFAVQNCNSLNISTVCSKQLTKIIAITALCTDIIFLSDIRLNSDPEHVEKIKKLFLYHSPQAYQAHFNSTQNKRGVGILISNRLNATVIKEYRDQDENILGLVL
jgi:hypothetical protein